MMGVLLTVAIFLPLVSALLVAIVRNSTFSRVISIATSVVVFLFAVYLGLNFDWNNSSFQHTIKLPWIQPLGISFSLGLDGMGMALFLLTALMFMVAFVWSVKIEDKTQFIPRPLFSVGDRLSWRLLRPGLFPLLSLLGIYADPYVFHHRSLGARKKGLCGEQILCLYLLW
jgi:formate hydrogenlyase subunit 3/multisubunit Na+/H+ antiporter MnhD subunit